MNVTIIGGGLAGCECAYTLAENGINVTLYEMKPLKKSPAHHSDNLCELVCSNSLRGDRLENAAGLLKAEMRLLNSLIIKAADATRVAAGGALAVDRLKFERYVTESITAHPLIKVVSGEVTSIPDSRPLVIATGPLTSDSLSTDIQKLVGDEFLSFYDAAAPILSSDSIDMEYAYAGDRYGKGSGDYINCPMDKETYTSFRRELANAEEAHVHGFEDSKVFEGCMPVEVLARRGEDTLRFGPLKPIGLRDPRTDKGSYAVVQLRRDDAEGAMLNIVGFQTHLTFGEQRRVFTMIPALRNAEFLRYGVMHRNTFINSPKLLTPEYMLKTQSDVYFAGQITGVEGYTESAASGLTAALAIIRGEPLNLPPETALGALSRHISASASKDFQPMNINFGIIPKLDETIKDKSERCRKTSERALKMLNEWL
ncbi:MAG: methylenetetrahydrofolate--tRNA-(uracil(54)-C(5))-methyltransferase (FADH(2)-oxidizing) TrmFO [Oscillospiraceae bacterium]|nr:methylenetetrahydrofolate--tRNA-(uracil(54)-C(5))-methyltransferase (FADH(2)-oxidizing) TrmFO [Oscillospiraceae bacterium]